MGLSSFVFAADLPIIDVPMRADSNEPAKEKDKPENYDPRLELRCPSPFKYKADVERDGDKAFVVGEVNTPKKLREMKGLTGVDWSVLTQRALPRMGRQQNKLWFEGANTFVRGSSEGFITPKQSVQDWIIKDAEKVISFGLTHQKVAEPLVAAIQAIEENPKNRGNTSEFHFNGRSYRVTGLHVSCFFIKTGDCRKEQLWSGWRKGGVQGTPFNDMIFSTWTGTITDVETGSQLKFDSLTPHMICRYGFYQGGSYRISPESIVEFFKLTKSNLSRSPEKRADGQTGLQ